MPRGQMRRAWLPGALALLSALACAQLLNVDGIEITGGESQGTAGNGPAPACAPRELRCVGAALQICREDQRGFRTAMVCSSPGLCCTDPALCPNPGCQEPACTPGSFRCDGALLSVCNEAQTGWTPIATCPSATQCNAAQGRCEDQPCNPAAPDRQCNAGELRECGATGWVSLRDCQVPALCDAAAGSCRAPEGCLDLRGNPGVMLPSAFRCDNGDLFRCNDAQTAFEFVETCMNLLLCSDLRSTSGDPVPAHLRPEELLNLGCASPVCTPGSYHCDGQTLERCNRYRNGYQPLQDCGSPGRCNAATGSCSAEECVPGLMQCSGNELQECTPERTWRTVKACTGASRCTLGGCSPTLCEVNDYRCDGTSLQRCNADGSDWISIHSCATAALCNAAARRCDTPVCSPGEQRCSRAGTLDTCAEGRNAWLPLRDCRAEAQLPENATPEQLSGVCDLSGGGRCNAPPSCAEGSLRCNGQYLERCRGNAWQPRERCASPALCDATGSGSCRAPTCAPGVYRCVTPGASPMVAEPTESMLGLTLQVCDTGGDRFRDVRDCPPDTYCDARHGQCDLCQPNEPLCFGDSLFFCSTDGQERELEKACTGGCGPDPENAGRPTCLEDLGSAPGQ